MLWPAPRDRPARRCCRWKTALGAAPRTAQPAEKSAAAASVLQTSQGSLGLPVPSAERSSGGLGPTPVGTKTGSPVGSALSPKPAELLSHVCGCSVPQLGD